MIFSKQSFLILVFVWCLAEQRAASAADPRQWGPYGVGVRTEVFVDEDRVCAITDKPRTLVTEIWYPIAKDSDEQPLNKFEDFWQRPEGVGMGKVAIGAFGGDFDKVNESFKNVARRNAPLDDGTFPLLVFSHGNGGFRHQNTYQTEYLASHGYIVVAPDHTGNAAVTILPDQIVLYNRKSRSEERRDDRPEDVAFLISHAQKLAASKDHWFSGQLVAEQIGVLGHSFGGYTASRATEIDTRIKAIIPMTLAGTLSTSGDGPPCKVPMLVILGDTDRTVGQRGNDASTAYFEKATGPKYLLNFKNAGHFTFTEMTQINTNFGDGIGIEKGKDGGDDFTFSDALEDQRITNEYSVAFFDAFLKDDAAARKFIDENHYADELSYRKE